MSGPVVIYNTDYIRTLAVPAVVPALVKSNGDRDRAAVSSVSKSKWNDIVKTIARTGEMAGMDKDILWELLQFEVFDPKYVYQKVALMLDAQSKESCVQEIVLLLAFHHEYGTVTDKSYLRMNAKAKTVWNALSAKWDVTTGKMGGPTSLTLGRLGAAFPYHLAKHAAEHPKTTYGPFGSSELPDYMKTSSFPALIPGGFKYSEMMLFCYTSYTCDQSLALQQLNAAQMSRDALRELFEKQLGFAQRSFTNGNFDTANRVKAMQYFKVGEDFEAIIGVYRNISEVTKNTAGEVPADSDAWDALTLKWR